MLANKNRPTNQAWREINGRPMLRTEGPGWRHWRQATAQPPRQAQRYDTRTQQTITEVEHFTPVVHFEHTEHPAAAIEAKLANPEHVWQTFDPREPSPLHAQLEAAQKAGFGDIVTAFKLAAKIKDRPPLGGFDLGIVRLAISAPIRHRCGHVDVRSLLAKHAHSEPTWRAETGEISEDVHFCPTLGS